MIKFDSFNDDSTEISELSQHRRHCTYLQLRLVFTPNYFFMHVINVAQLHSKISGDP